MSLLLLIIQYYVGTEGVYGCHRSGSFLVKLISGRNRGDNKTDRKGDIQSKAVSVENDEPGWDEPEPAKMEKPLAQSTPSTSTATTPAKQTATPVTRDKVKVDSKASRFVLPTATLPMNKEVMVMLQMK